MRVSTTNTVSACAASKKPAATRFPVAAKMAAALLESACQAIISTDRAGRIVLANHQAEELFGYSREELLGSSLEMLLPEARRGAHTQMRADYLRRPSVRPMGRGLELSARRKGGFLWRWG
jgi:PAS domain S-box-containing protein